MLVPALSVASVERQQTDIINSGDGCQAASSPDCLSGLDPLRPIERPDRRRIRPLMCRHK
jgi:hypothetical protein